MGGCSTDRETNWLSFLRFGWQFLIVSIEFFHWKFSDYSQKCLGLSKYQEGPKWAAIWISEGYKHIKAFHRTIWAPFWSIKRNFWVFNSNFAGFSLNFSFFMQIWYEFQLIKVIIMSQLKFKQFLPKISAPERTQVTRVNINAN